MRVKRYTKQLARAVALYGNTFGGVFGFDAGNETLGACRDDSQSR